MSRSGGLLGVGGCILLLWVGEGGGDGGLGRRGGKGEGGTVSIVPLRFLDKESLALAESERQRS